MSKAFDFAKSIEGSGSFDGLVIPSSSAAAAGVPGELRVNNGVVERWSDTDFVPQWRAIDEDAQPNPFLYYLVIGGGGAGGGMNGGGYHSDGAGGGGAGGYRTNFGSGNISGGLSPVEAAFVPTMNTAYNITVGAGGNVSYTNGGNGGDSTFHTISSVGGGGGGYAASGSSAHANGGGSGGGGAGLNFASGGAGSTGQGFAGGGSNGSNQAAAGGGGAGAVGADARGTNGSSGGVGGDGIASSITGTSVYRAGGGGAGGSYGGSAQAGGQGGGGAGGGPTNNNPAPVPGTDGTGGGGGGTSAWTSQVQRYGASGGTGVIILRTVGGLVARFTAGVTVNGTTVTVNNTAVAGTSVGSDLLWIITAASSDTVTFATS